MSKVVIESSVKNPYVPEDMTNAPLRPREVYLTLVIHFPHHVPHLILVGGVAEGLEVLEELALINATIRIYQPPQR